jgi:hypothetical protein
MNDFPHFGELYRAAYAERNPERKQILLRQVELAIRDWEEMLQIWVADNPKSHDRSFQTTCRAA